MDVVETIEDIFGICDKFLVISNWGMSLKYDKFELGISNAIRDKN